MSEENFVPYPRWRFINNSIFNGTWTKMSLCQRLHGEEEKRERFYAYILAHATAVTSYCYGISIASNTLDGQILAFCLALLYLLYSYTRVPHAQQLPRKQQLPNVYFRPDTHNF